MSKKNKNIEAAEPQIEEVSEDVKEVETTEKEVVEAVIEEPKNYIYLGPTITGVVRHANVFKDGVLPNALNKAVLQMPALKRLIVPVDEAPILARKLNKNSMEANIYKLAARKNF